MKNQIELVGKLVNTRGLDEVKRANRDGSEFVSGSVTVDIGKGELLEVDVYSKKLTKDGQPSKLFTRYLELPEEVGSKIKIGGAEFTENRFWGRNDQIASVNKVSGRFFNVARDTDESQATFTFNGYVVKPIYERLDREGNLLYYEILMAQPNWNSTKPMYVKFAIDKDSTAIINVLEARAPKGATIELKGVVTIETETRVVEQDIETSFGEVPTEKYVNTYVKYTVTGGSTIPDPNSELVYRPDEIAMLTKAYDDEALTIEEAARAKGNSNETSFTNKDAAKSSRTKLI
jgi:hypothetical protein